MNHHTAPWGASLVVISSLTTALCVALAILLAWTGGGVPLWGVLLPCAVPGVGILFTIRGYTVASDAILVQRLFWVTRVPLAGLQSVEFRPNAMRWSIRTCGNGGLFSFSGFYWNRALGAHRALVTDPKRTVVLRFANRTVVVSPGTPETFAQAVSARALAGGNGKRGGGSGSQEVPSPV